MNRMFSLARRVFPANRMLVFSTLLCMTLVTTTGCLSSGPRPALTEKRELTSPDSLQLVGDLARPWGVKWIEVGGVTLSVGLEGTGSNPAPSQDYKMLISEMQVRDVARPETVLASPSTALTLVKALIPPGAQKGDRVDVEVRVPNKSKTTSLNGGFMMLTRLKEFARVNGRLSSGHVIAMAQGDILVDSVIEGSDDPVLMTRGRILGGGVVTQSRELGLRIKDANLSVKTSSYVGKKINERFHIYDHGVKQGVANPKKDSFISLVVHPRYRDNLMRYIRVIENIPVRESASDLVQRLVVLQSRLMDPDMASVAAVQLESLGEDGVPVLKDGLQSDNTEVRFYAAEALAYLDVADAANVLAEVIRSEPAFRWRAFRALGAMDNLASQEELAMLLNEESAETRYGAFRTLLKLAPDDPMIRGEVVSEDFRLHTISVDSTPMVHVSKSDHPEIVIFGEGLQVLSPLVAFAGSNLVVRSTEDGRMRVRRLSQIDAEDRQLIVGSNLDDVIRAVADLGGSYADVVQVISEMRSKGCLECRLESGAVPQPGRTLYREKNDVSSAPDAKSFTGAGDLSRGAEVPLLSEAPVIADRDSSRPPGPIAVDALAPVVDAVPTDSVDGLVPPAFDGDFNDEVESEDQAGGVVRPRSESEPIRMVIGDVPGNEIRFEGAQEVPVPGSGMPAGSVEFKHP